MCIRVTNKRLDNIRMHGANVKIIWRYLSCELSEDICHMNCLKISVMWTVWRYVMWTVWRYVMWTVWRYLSCELSEDICHVNCLKTSNIALFWLHYGLWPVRNETLFNFQWVRGVNQPGHEADHWHLSNVKVCSCMFPACVCLNDMHRHHFILLEFQRKCVCAYYRYSYKKIRWL